MVTEYHIKRALESGIKFEVDCDLLQFDDRIMVMLRSDVKAHSKGSSFNYFQDFIKTLYPSCKPESVEIHNHTIDKVMCIKYWSFLNSINCEYNEVTQIFKFTKI